MTGFWYLATPYTKHPRGPIAAHDEACRAAAICFKAGIQVFAPIPHTHAIAEVGKIAGHFEQWSAFDELMIGLAVGVIVVKMDGWKESVGIKAEIARAEQLGKPVVYMNPAGPPPELIRWTQQARIEVPSASDFTPRPWTETAEYYIAGGIDIRDVIEAFGFNFNRGAVVKYMARAGRKPGNDELLDLKKAREHINREIAVLERAKGSS